MSSSNVPTNSNVPYGGQPVVSPLNIQYQNQSVLPPPTGVISGAPVGYAPQTYAPQAVYAPQASYSGSAQQYAYQQTYTHQASYSPQSSVQTNVVTQAPVKGESRIEYVPYEKTVTEYEEVRKQIQVPVTTYVTDYHIYEHAVEYVPQVYQEKIIEYQPVERIVERVDYQAVTKQNFMGVQSAQNTQTTYTPQTRSTATYVQGQPTTVVGQPTVFQQSSVYQSSYAQPVSSPIRTSYAQPAVYAPPTSYVPAPVYGSTFPQTTFPHATYPQTTLPQPYYSPQAPLAATQAPVSNQPQQLQQQPQSQAPKQQPQV